MAVESVFCLSMPGGHMTYLGVLSNILLRRLEADPSFFKANSLHGADPLLPPELAPGKIVDHKITNVDDRAWESWYRQVLSAYISPVVIKDSWINHADWNGKLSNQQRLAILSDSTSTVDFVYCYLNAIEKIPLHMYRRLMDISIAHPKLWKLLNKPGRIKALGTALGDYPCRHGIAVGYNILSFPTRDILRKDFPERLWVFYQSRGLDVSLSRTVFAFHHEFVTKQQDNYNLCMAIMQGYRVARGPYDDILFYHLDHSGAMGS